MCDLCDKLKQNPDYAQLIEKMLKADIGRLEFSKSLVSEISSLSNLLYSSIEYPVKLVHPMFEARAAYSVPHNYYQPLTIAGERHNNSFAHGSMRSIFFIGEKLMVLSKTVNHKDGKEFFTSFFLGHFNKGEYSAVWDGDSITISFNGEKTLKNMVTGKTEKKDVMFNFTGQSVKNHIVSREDVMTSSQFKAIYSKHGTVAGKAASIDLEGYALTVPHFSPHPYLLQLHEQLGFSSNRDFQENGVLEYFRAHLK